MKNKNQSIFYYGLWALAVQLIGVILICLCFVVAFFSVIGSLICLALGIIVYIKGKAMRFDYKRRSGQIIHQGDGW